MTAQGARQDDKKALTPIRTSRTFKGCITGDQPRVPHHDSVTAVTAASIRAMQEAMEDPDTDVAQHAIDAAVSAGPEGENFSVDLRFKNLPRMVVTDQYPDGTRITTAHPLVRVTIKTKAPAILSYRDPRTGQHEQYLLKPEQQEILDAYTADVQGELSHMAHGTTPATPTPLRSSGTTQAGSQPEQKVPSQ